MIDESLESLAHGRLHYFDDHMKVHFDDHLGIGVYLLRVNFLQQVTHHPKGGFFIFIEHLEEVGSYDTHALSVLNLVVPNGQTLQNPPKPLLEILLSAEGLSKCVLVDQVNGFGT